MPNGVRNSIWAVFFLAGMAFMAALIFMLRPELFSNQTVRERPGSLVVVGGAENEPVDIETEPPPVREPAREIASPSYVEKEEVKVDQPPRPVAEKQTEAARLSVSEQPPMPLPAVRATTTLSTGEGVVRRLKPGRAYLGMSVSSASCRR